MKSRLREEFKAKRQNISDTERNIMSNAIKDFFLSSEFIENQTFHIFIPIKKFNEIDTNLIIVELWKRGKTVIVPKMEGKQLLNCEYTPQTELATNSWGIQEPKNCVQIDSKEIDVVLIPMLISDKKGNRIGYGGGFYDRFLPTLKKDVKLVGINYFEPIETIEKENHDIPLSALITPKGIIKF